MKHRESLLSAHHNYLVNNMLSPGFVLGDPGSQDDFYFLADLVLPGESTPRVSARLFDEGGHLLFELKWNRMGENPGRFSYQSTPGGFCVLNLSGQSLLNVDTKKFANGYLTHIQGRLYDRRGRLRLETSHESIQVHGEATLALNAPYVFS